MTQTLGSDPRSIIEPALNFPTVLPSSSFLLTPEDAAKLEDATVIGWPQTKGLLPEGSGSGQVPAGTPRAAWGSPSLTVRAMFPAIHNPQAGVLFLHPLLIPVPGAVVLFASAPERCLYLVARLCAQCPTTTEAQEGNVNPPPPRIFSSPYVSAVPTRKGLRLGHEA